MSKPNRFEPWIDNILSIISKIKGTAEDRRETLIHIANLLQQSQKRQHAAVVRLVKKHVYEPEKTQLLFALAQWKRGTK